METNVRRVIAGKVMPNEDLIEAITEMVIKNEIRSGLVSVIGALKKVTIGFFDVDKKKYKFKTYNEDVELISCLGNIAFKNNTPFIHLHVSIGREDYSMVGGHLSQPSIVSITGEVFIYEINKKLERIEDPQFGLSLLNI